ncbi:asialoglycoprotein receptor 1-like isoform X2 [Erythrolamprus reginae]|uniref:asialoglycoprotein receptor 1-like isoform X2 n=1 Tax=Erythrolamprus reginae TaxID=121349 RepID=UPI00396C6D0A
MRPPGAPQGCVTWIGKSEKDPGDGMESSKSPTAPQMYEDLLPPNVEKETHIEKDFAFSKPFAQRLCPTSRLTLVLMVSCGILVLSIGILGIQGVQFTKGLRGTQKGVKNISQATQQGVTDIKAKRGGTELKLDELEKSLQQENNTLLKAIKLYQTQVDTLEQNSRALRCEIMEMKSNGSKSGCCPKGWLTFRNSCYWTTWSRNTWQGAKEDCEEKKAHLVILNSADEKAFVKTYRKGSNTWIGLTDSSGDWKWVDGSSYTVDQKDWDEGQPDHWYGHGSGGGEDCAQIMQDGLWNDNVCSRTFSWVCEMELRI